MLAEATRARAGLDETIALTEAAVDFEWRRLTSNGGALEAAWDSSTGRRMTAVVSDGQALAAANAVTDVPALLAAQGLAPAATESLRTTALAGVASDGRALEALLFQSVRYVQAAIANGATFANALPFGAAFLQRAVATQIADAYRVASGVTSLVSPAATLQVRVVNPGACARCAVLAGTTSHNAVAFRRHPQCRCINVPTSSKATDGFVSAREYFDSMTEAEQNRVFTHSGAQAIRDGADLNQVVNSRRGMSTTASGTLVTSEGMTRRGYAYHVMGQNSSWREQVGDSTNRFKVTEARLMPEAIYKLAGGSRSRSRDLLKAYGYF